MLSVRNCIELLAPFDEKLSIVAGYAIDLMDTVRNVGVYRVRLDMTRELKGYAGKALMVIIRIILDGNAKQLVQSARDANNRGVCFMA